MYLIAYRIRLMTYRRRTGPPRKQKNAVRPALGTPKSSVSSYYTGSKSSLEAFLRASNHCLRLFKDPADHRSRLFKEHLDECIYGQILNQNLAIDTLV